MFAQETNAKRQDRHCEQKTARRRALLPRGHSHDECRRASCAGAPSAPSGVGEMRATKHAPSSRSTDARADGHRRHPAGRRRRVGRPGHRADQRLVHDGRSGMGSDRGDIAILFGGALLVCPTRASRPRPGQLTQRLRQMSACLTHAALPVGCWTRLPTPGARTSIRITSPATTTRRTRTPRARSGSSSRSA